MTLQPACSTMVLLAGLLASQMNLAVTPKGRVFLYNQKWDIPPDDGLFIVINRTGEKVLSSNLEYANDPVSGDLNEIKTTNRQEVYTINLFSRNADAINREHEVTFAFHSTAAQQMAEKYSLQIAPVPLSVNDVSALEASARLNRTAVTIRVLRAYSLTSAVQSYNSFPTAPLLTEA